MKLDRGPTWARAMLTSGENSSVEERFASPKQRNAARRGSLSALMCQDGTEAEARAREVRAWAMRGSYPRAHPTPRRRERLN